MMLHKRVQQTRERTLVYYVTPNAIEDFDALGEGVLERIRLSELVLQRRKGSRDEQVVKVRNSIEDLIDEEYTIRI